MAAVRDLYEILEERYGRRSTILTRSRSTNGMSDRRFAEELSPNFGDGLRVQAAAVWDFEDAELAATSIPSVNLTP